MHWRAGKPFQEGVSLCNGDQFMQLTGKLSPDSVAEMECGGLQSIDAQWDSHASYLSYGVNQRDFTIANPEQIHPIGIKQLVI